MPGPSYTAKKLASDVGRGDPWLQPQGFGKHIVNLYIISRCAINIRYDNIYMIYFDFMTYIYIKGLDEAFCFQNI